MELDHTVFSNEESREQRAEGVICIKMRREKRWRTFRRGEKKGGERRDCSGEERDGGREGKERLVGGGCRCLTGPREKRGGRSGGMTHSLLASALEVRMEEIVKVRGW